MWAFTVFLGGCGCLAETGSCFQVWTSKYLGYRSFAGHLQVVDMLEFQWIFIVPEYSCKVYLSIFCAGNLVNRTNIWQNMFHDSPVQSTFFLMTHL